MSEMVGLSRDGLEAWLLDQIAGRQGIWQHDLVSWEQISGLIASGAASYWVGSEQITNNRLSRALTNLGARRVRKGVLKERYWLIRDIELHEEQGSLEEWRKAFPTAKVIRLQRRKEATEKAAEAAVSSPWD